MNRMTPALIVIVSAAVTICGVALFRGSSIRPGDRVIVTPIPGVVKNATGWLATKSQAEYPAAFQCLMDEDLDSLGKMTMQNRMSASPIPAEVTFHRWSDNYAQIEMAAIRPDNIRGTTFLGYVCLDHVTIVPATDAGRKIVKVAQDKRTSDKWKSMNQGQDAPPQNQ